MFSSYNVSKLRYKPLNLNIKMCTTGTTTQNHLSMTILMICAYALKIKKHVQFKFPGMFQT